MANIRTMTQEEVLDEIRALLLEPQTNTVQTPWRYDDAALIRLMRPLLRRLRMLGLPLRFDMDASGAFTADAGEDEGVLIAYYVAAQLMRGDLTQRLLDGDLGVVYKSGVDTIDTSLAARGFQDKAQEYLTEFQTYLSVYLANADAGANSVFGNAAAQPDTPSGG